MLIAPWTLVLTVWTGIVLVMNRARRTGEVEDLVHLDVKREADVVAHDLEVRVIQQRDDVLASAGVEIVGTDHLVALCE